MKTQFKELKNELKKNHEEISLLKKNTKNSKLNELKSENEILTSEIQKLRDKIIELQNKKDNSEEMKNLEKVCTSQKDYINELEKKVKELQKNPKISTNHLESSESILLNEYNLNE